jgi:tripartite-type tricarboxylate transporter receptor subunit TctC
VGSAGTHAVNQGLYAKLPYHVLRDFQPIARLADPPSILAVHPSLPAKNVKELVALALETNAFTRKARSLHRSAPRNSRRS